MKKQGQLVTRQGIIGSLEWIKNMREIIDRIRPVNKKEEGFHETL